MDKETKETIEWLKSARDTYNGYLTNSEDIKSMNRAFDVAEDCVKSVALIATGAATDLSKYVNIVKGIESFIDTAEWTSKEDLIEMINTYAVPRLFAKYLGVNQ